ncbi:uncharacterized protein A4U43_C04F3730 [Asparagus officinalis]|uniref:Uncharacterized protein n=1 Tax=Asparagus officinalis TaxID=4686 RepID=A0A5P1EYQ5_ASPOF|nr:uncharacterized protein A4U43_C04F3730 [Asparagus officinalis]
MSCEVEKCKLRVWSVLEKCNVMATLDEEEKLAKQQEETLKAHYNKFEMIESVMQDSSAPRLARKYGFNLAMDDEWHDRD